MYKIKVDLLAFDCFKFYKKKKVSILHSICYERKITKNTSINFLFERKKALTDSIPFMSPHGASQYNNPSYTEDSCHSQEDIGHQSCCSCCRILDSQQEYG